MLFLIIALAVIVAFVAALLINTGIKIGSAQKLEGVLRSKGIPARVEYWGHDVDHDWPWWFKMVEHYVPQLL